MKKVIALFLALVLCLGMFAGCANNEQTPTTTEEPTPDDGVLRVLLLGHSLGNDSIWILPEIAKKEGFKDMVFGMLYYSGCRLDQHINFLSTDAAEYQYRQFDLNKDGDWQIADPQGAFYHGGIGADLTRIEDHVSMKFAIEMQDWDVVVLQAGVMEAAGKTSDGELTTDEMQTIMDYVNKCDIDKTTKTKFAYNMIWSFPSDDALLSDYYNGLLHSNFANTREMFEAIYTATKDIVEPYCDWAYIFPSGTAMENAHSSYLGNGVYRDTAHASDIGRIVTAYTWLCTLTGKDISEMKFAPIAGRALREAPYSGSTLARELTELEKNVVIEAVGNAIKTPYALTPSAYTEAPAQ